VDLKLLADRIYRFFQDDGFKELRLEQDPNGAWYEIQAKKGGVLRTVGASRKAIHINIKGVPNNFEVEMGVGEWGKNVAAAAVLTGGIGLIGLGFDAEFKHKDWNKIKESVDSLENSYKAPANVAPPSHQDTTIPTRELGRSAPAAEDPEKILAMRLAKGDITLEQYTELKKALAAN
jgi:hypothetical protein